jgi:hypothetical protein
MRVLADIAKLRDDPIWAYLLVEVLAAQTVALAAYEGRKFADVQDIRGAVLRTAGYPMLNPIGGGPPQASKNVEAEAARRVAEMVGVKVE